MSLKQDISALIHSFFRLEITFKHNRGKHLNSNNMKKKISKLRWPWLGGGLSYPNTFWAPTQCVQKQRVGIEGKGE